MKISTSLVFKVELKDNQNHKLFLVCNEQIAFNLCLATCCLYYLLECNGFFFDEIQHLIEKLTDSIVGARGPFGANVWPSTRCFANRWFYGLTGDHKAPKRYV